MLVEGTVVLLKLYNKNNTLHCDCNNVKYLGILKLLLLTEESQHASEYDEALAVGYQP